MDVGTSTGADELVSVLVASAATATVACVVSRTVNQILTCVLKRCRRIVNE